MHNGSIKHLNIENLIIKSKLHNPKKKGGIYDKERQ